MSLIGAHVRNNFDELCEDIYSVKNNGGNFIQLFTNRMSKKAIIEYDKIKKILDENNMKSVVHCSYTINLCQNWDYHSWWLKQFILEIKMAKYIDAIAVVIHCGKQLEMKKEIAINNMYTALLHVLNKTEDTNMKILIETSSGQGSELFYNLEELSSFYKKINNTKFKNRIGICLDTCHVFVAGYDLRGSKNACGFLEYVEEIIGLNNIKLIHLNDSLNNINSRIDRHDNIGNGFIGKKSLNLIVGFFKNLNVPIVLETPFEGIMTDLYSIVKQNKFK